MKKRSLWMSAVAALVVAAALAGCGTTTYFAGRTLPPSGLRNRVLIAIQNPSPYTKGGLQFVDAYYDVRFPYNNKNGSFVIPGYTDPVPTSIQNMPEEQNGAVYSPGDGSLLIIDYRGERAAGPTAGLSGIPSSVFITRNQDFTFAANQSGIITVVDNTVGGGTFSLSLSGVYRVSVNRGGSVAMAFVQNSNNAFFVRKLTTAQTISYSGGSWPAAAMDCEPHNAPVWCVFQAQSPDHVDTTGNYYGAPLTFDHPVKAVFSADGGSAYVLSCGPECGGSNASVSVLPVGPMIFLPGQQSGTLPTTGSLTTINTPGGASNALVNGSTLYTVGIQKMLDGFWGGYMTVVDLTSNSVVPSTALAPNPVSISDGQPTTLAGVPSRMLLADDNTLWIGMSKCNYGERINNSQPYGCLTMVNTASNTVTLLEPFVGFGDATGIAAVTGLHKIYAAVGGQVYIYSTTNGIAIDNQYVTVTGTASDVAYMDGNSDSNNTVY